MSYCTSPIVTDEFYDKLVTEFLSSPNLETWSLLSLRDMVLNGNPIQEIAQVIPFRGNGCTRSRRCCGVCTRRCKTRCVQDCLHRIYMWRMMVESTPKERRDELPLSVRLIVNQKFEALEDMSWVVGDILSRSTNTELRRYIEYAGLNKNQNPYKIDYAPGVAISSDTGKRIVNPVSGVIQYREYPESGLCPYCAPSVAVDRRFSSNGSNSNGSGY